MALREYAELLSQFQNDQIIKHAANNRLRLASSAFQSKLSNIVSKSRFLFASMQILVLMATDCTNSSIYMMPNRFFLPQIGQHLLQERPYLREVAIIL